MTDLEILEKVKKGDESVLEYLYKKYYRMMHRLVIQNSGTEDEAKDVYQDALVAFWQKAVSGNFVLTSKLSTYLYSVCSNLWMKELEKKSRYKDSSESESGEEPDYDQEERNKIVSDAIAELGDPCKSILMYYYFDGLNMNDIAEKLGFANSDTAKTKKYKCKERLDKLIKQKFTERDFF